MVEMDVGALERAALTELVKFGGSPVLGWVDNPWLAISKDRPYLSGSFKSAGEAIAYASWCIETDTSPEPEKNFVVCCLKAFFERTDIVMEACEDEPEVRYTKVTPILMSDRDVQ